jgi:O-antigen ligase
MPIQVEKFIGQIRSHKLISITTLAYAILTLGHIPLNTFNTLFDKNQAVEFFNVLMVASLFGLIIFRKRKELVVPRSLFALVGALLLALFASAIASKNLFGSITGDSFRYAGIASTVALILVALFHGFFTDETFPKLMKGYLFALFLTEVLAVMQFFKLITLPGIQGNPASTFGNLDFYAAYLGTSFPLILYVFLTSTTVGKRFSVGLGVLTLICLRMADAKQGYLDFLIAAVIVVLALVYRRVRREKDGEEFSLGVKTTLYTFAIFLWLEFIFIIPFIGKSIPHIGDDPQVAIRGVMWLAGVNQFLSRPLLGIGPDQYGNYYEEFRTVNSTVILGGTSTNDAHSMTTQTLATTGLIGSLLFLLLIAYLVRSILVILDQNKLDRRATYALALFLFIYITNATISPIVLPHKYLFWAVSGFLIFTSLRAEESPAWKPAPKSTVITLVSALTALSLFVGVGFGIGQVNFMRWGEAIKSNPSASVNVRISPLIPCNTYFTYLANFISPRGDAALEKLSRAQVAIAPRCQEAQKMLAKLAYNRQDFKEMRKRVYILINLTPVQREVLDLATLYAIKDGDVKLQAKVERQLALMGVKRIQIG